MAIREIHTYPDAVLKRRPTDVANIDGAIATLVEDMAETMYAAPGIGLAAPQVGASQRIIVLDVPRGGGGRVRRLRILSPRVSGGAGDPFVGGGGFLSVPDNPGPEARSRRILLRA